MPWHLGGTLEKRHGEWGIMYNGEFHSLDEMFEMCSGTKIFVSGE